MKKFTLKFMLLGLIVPILFLLIFNFTQQITLSRHVHFLIIDTQLILWPTSIFLMAGGTEATIISVISNVFLYSLIGVLIWLGFIKRRKLFLTIFIIVIIILICYYIFMITVRGIYF